MDRRDTALAFLAFGVCTVFVKAQQPAQRFRIGILGSSSSEPLRESLREAGYIEGRNLVIEWRDAQGRPERFDALAAELARSEVQAIVATNPAATIAAKRATTSIPIVMVNTPDPVQLSLVASLARPGGNVTGTTTLSAELSVKQLELLKQAVPRAARIAVLSNPDNPWHPLALRGIQAAGPALGVPLQFLAVRAVQELDQAFTAAAKERAAAVLVLADPLFFFHRVRIAELAAQHRLPAMYGLRGHVDAGGLMSYWANQEELYRRVASYVDRILKGAKPSELPIEQPMRYELVINAKTAQALNLTIPHLLLSRADEVIR